MRQSDREYLHIKVDVGGAFPRQSPSVDVGAGILAS